MSIKIEKVYDKSFFSDVGTEYVCTGFMGDPIPATMVQSNTDVSVGHWHYFKVDAEGNGWTIEIVSPPTFEFTNPNQFKLWLKDEYMLKWNNNEQFKYDAIKQINHIHKINNWVVGPAQSKCYPNCGDYVGSPGIGPHSHKMTGMQNYSDYLKLGGTAIMAPTATDITGPDMSGGGMSGDY